MSESLKNIKELSISMGPWQFKIKTRRILLSFISIRYVGRQ